jgi:hypothetical protein
MVVVPKSSGQVRICIDFTKWTCRLSEKIIHISRDSSFRFFELQDPHQQTINLHY